MKKLLIPSPENREACLQQLWEKLYIEEGIDKSTQDNFVWLERALSAPSAGKAALAASWLANNFLDRACIDRRLDWLATSDTFLRQSFAYVYLARELNLLARMAPDWPELNPDGLLLETIAWQGLSVACGSPWFALWIAPHLHNQFGNPDPGQALLAYDFDKPARGFMELLQRSLITGAWPAHVDVPALSAYGRLLEACGQPAHWAAALVDFCDWRVANAYGYEFMGATKRRRQSSLRSAMDWESVHQVFPIELFTLRLAYERATGVRLSLDAPHPMLQGPLMARPFPQVEPMFEDEWTRQLVALREEASDGRLAARASITAKYL